MTEQLDDRTAWHALAATWRRPETPEIDLPRLRARIQRETTVMRRSLVGEIALSAAVVGWTVWNLVREPVPYAMLFAVDSWAVLGIVWAFVLSGRRGLWKPSADTTEAYLVLGRQRAQQRLRTAWLALGLVVAQLVVAKTASILSSPIQWIASAAFVAWALWSRARAIGEQRRLDALLAELRR
jgi:hypothetical protein